MPTPQKIELDRLGIIAGAGTLPAYLTSICEEKNIQPYIIGFRGQTDPKLMDNNPHLWTGIGSAGKILQFFKSNNVKDLVLIGAVKRPKFHDIKPDLKAMQILTRIGFSSLGDNDLLTALRKEFEKEGFNIHGIHSFCDQLLVKDGIIGTIEPQQEDQTSIEVGIAKSQEIGALDIGQSVIVQNGVILGVEDENGTDALIRKCESLQKKGRGGILVKTCKPQQDKDLDLPTIGVETIINAHKAGLSGIAVQADNVIIVDPKNVAKYADKYKIFVIGVPIDTKKS